MLETSPSERRATLTGKKILEHLNQPVKVFLENGIALDGVLLDYFYDPAEREGVLILSSQKAGCEPSLVFRKYITTVQPAHPAHPAHPAQTKKKGP